MELLSFSRMLARWFLLVLGVFALVGCGGGGGKGTTNAYPLLSISWPARSKTTPTFDALSSAESVNIVITSKVNGSSSTLNANRPSDPAPQIISYSLTNKLPVGACNVVLNLYAQSNEQGAVVGTVNTAAFISGGGILYGPDNNPIESFQVTGVIASVTITGPGVATTNNILTASVNDGSTIQFGFSCFDANQNP